MFVVIDDPFVEGLVRVEALSDDYYVFDEPACRLVGRRSGRTFALGDSVKVEVQSVSVVRRKIDFALAGHRARHHDDRGDRFGRKGGGTRSAGRRDKRGRRDEKPTARGRIARTARAARTSGALTSRSRGEARRRSAAEATGGAASRRRRR